jgi:PqqD family protein of HPr-rel-A system
MSNRNSPSLWIGVDESTLRWEQFGDGYLVYHIQSGETHFLNVTAAEILKLLQANPKTLPETVTQTCSMFNLEEDPSFAQKIGGIIREFSHVGLICSVPK